MIRKTSIVLLVMFFCVGATCHKRVPVDVISDYMDRISSIYIATEKLAISLHDSGVLKGAVWNQIVDLNVKEIDPVFARLWPAWKRLPDTDKALTEFLNSKDYQSAMSLVAELAMLIGDDSGLQKIVDLQTMINKR